MGRFSKYLRSAVLIIAATVSMAAAGIRLMKLQIVDGADYLEKSKQNTLGTQEIHAARGEIVDCKGIPVVQNKVGFNVIVERAFLPDDVQRENEIILRTAKLLQKDGADWLESIPITRSYPYEYLPNRERDISVMLDGDHLRLNVYATAENCIDELIRRYEISDEYTREEKRIIAGIRYEMLCRSFSLSNRYTFAEDIPMDTVSRIKELSFLLPGVDIVEEAIREYAQGDIFAHGIGTVGPIYAEEYAELKSQGYKLNDSLGKSGIEKAMESELRGHNGTRQITISNGTVTSVRVTDEAVPGHTVQLTIDSEFQREVQQILANHILWLNENAESETKGKNANGGSIVVLEAKTGAVRALVNNPDYNINDYVKNYSEVASRENSPLLNRAIDGLYRPGSTFKTVTATAALNEGIISGRDTVRCQRLYTYYTDIDPPKCTGYHNDIDVTHALQVSCNVFFYDVGRRCGIDMIQKYAAYYGLGEALNLEIGGSAGHIAGPQYFEKIDQNWTPGQVIQTAIGQSETAVSPLQLAVQAATIANRGVRYQPYLVEGVYSYNMDELIYKTQPRAVSEIPIHNEEMYRLIEDGMMLAAENMPSQYSLMELPDGHAAIKTGTPQRTKTQVNSVFIGYYPVEDPVIAFAGIVEQGESSKWMVRQIIDAYFDYEYPEENPPEETSESAPTPAEEGTPAETTALEE